MDTDKIELLSVDLLDQHREIVSEFENLSHKLKHGLGWHYLLDLPWAVNELREVTQRSSTVLDAGAGRGLMQFWLAEHGINVISVDRGSRSGLPQHIQKNYCITAWRKGDFSPLRPKLRDFLPSHSPKYWSRWPKKFASACRGLITRAYPGKIFMYNQDLRHLPDLLDASVDAVVSISALEHNSPKQLQKVVNELLRVLKPGGKIVATLGAARDSDWYHQPSHGWCYTEHTLREIFQISSDASSNYGQFDQLFENLRNCTELCDKLAPYYLKPGNHGMPSGKWDPEYHVVGVVKTKPIK